MFLNPFIWWGIILGLVSLAAAGAATSLWGVRRLRARPERAGGRPLAAAGALAAALGVSGLVVFHAYGPWWRHAPSWVLIRTFPTYAPHKEKDLVTSELTRRVIRWRMAREDRERLAGVCAGVLADESSTRETGLKAIRLLVWLKDEKGAATPAVLSALRRPELRATLLAEMSRISDMGPGVRRAMMGIVVDETAPAAERCRAAWTLGWMGHAAAAEKGIGRALVAALEGPDVEAPGDSVPRSAAVALGRIGPGIEDREEVAAALEAASEDQSLAFATRYAARVAALCVRGEAPTEAHAHAAMLRSTDVKVRRRAALGLRWGRDIRSSGVAAAELVGALGDEDEVVREWARETLRDLVRADSRYEQMLRTIAAAGDAATAERVRVVLEGER